MDGEEMYIVHNNIMAAAHRELQERGYQKTADEMQKFAQDYHGSIILHQLIHTTMQLMQLDKSTEPKGHSKITPTKSKSYETD